MKLMFDWANPQKPAYFAIIHNIAHFLCQIGAKYCVFMNKQIKLIRTSSKRICWRKRANRLKMVTFNRFNRKLHKLTNK